MDLKKDKQYTRGKRPMETKIYSVHSSVFSSEKKKYFSLVFLIFFLEKSLPPQKNMSTQHNRYKLFSAPQKMAIILSFLEVN